jgi:hypothetical protein
MHPHELVYVGTVNANLVGLRTQKESHPYSSHWGAIIDMLYMLVGLMFLSVWSPPYSPLASAACPSQIQQLRQSVRIPFAKIV